MLQVSPVSQSYEEVALCKERRRSTGKGAGSGVVDVVW